jgi:hypothetical protein
MTEREIEKKARCQTSQPRNLLRIEPRTQNGKGGMPFINDPLRRKWNQIAKDLRELQDVVDLYKKRFDGAGQNEIAEELEGCVLALIGAEGVAKTLALEIQKLR